MEQPPGYVQHNSSLVCLLKNSLYGLKQAPRAWYAKMDRFLLDTSFSRCHSDPNVYTKKVGNHLIILVLYVDDIILTGTDLKILTHVKSSLKKNFEMLDLGHLHYFLYVDDLILTGSDPKILTHVKSSLKQNFEMSDLGHLHYFLVSKSYKPKNESFFPSLSMLVTFFVASQWKIVNQPLFPSSLE